MFDKIKLWLFIGTSLILILFQACSEYKSKDEASQTSIKMASVNLEQENTESCDLSELNLSDGFRFSRNYECATIQYDDLSTSQNYDLFLPQNSHYGNLKPLVIFIHGGGYVGGSKTSAYNDQTGIEEYLKQGFAFASIEYRRATAAVDHGLYYRKGVTGDYPAAMADAALALQDLRYRSSQYGIDPNKIALMGPSAGGGISLWLGLHDDLRNQGYDNDPRRSLSSRVDCVAVTGAQTTLNMREIQSLFWSPETLRDPSATNIFNETFDFNKEGVAGIYGLTNAEYFAEEVTNVQNRLSIQESLIDSHFESMHEASPISHVSRDDANIKILLSYGQPYGIEDIHSPIFGLYLTKGKPTTLNDQFSRLSFDDIGLEYSLKVNQTAKSTDSNFSERNYQNIFKFISNTCF